MSLASAALTDRKAVAGVVADIWAIYTDPRGQPTGKFDVALLPDESHCLLAENIMATSAGAQ